MSALDILKHHQVKKTPARLAIINALQNSKDPLSENEIKESMQDMYDRITFYRNMQTLQIAGILHKIVVDNTTIRYALNDCQLGHQHKNVHAHFYCEKCQSVVCLNQLIIPAFCLPEGYTYYDADVIIKGTCDHCNQ